MKEPVYLQERKVVTSEAALGRAKQALPFSEAGLSRRLPALLRPEPQGQRHGEHSDKALVGTGIS